ncbi:MAG: PD-(D/E)XK nuclease family protein [Actinobacteria bacterium]|nr:PD-(D/E)XK nuclease family protein [Actinomycetota bacterium]
MNVVFPHVTPGDPVRISASTYVTWKKCPDQANARLRGIYGPDTRPAFVGSLAHLVFSRHLRDGPITDDGFVQACREEIGSSGLNTRMSQIAPRLSQLAPIIEEARALYHRFVKLPTVGFEGAEVEVNHEPSVGVELVGKIDAVYQADLGGHRLVDWKTGELGDSDDQLAFYALLWTLNREELPVCVEAVSVTSGDVHRTEPTADQVGLVAAEVAAMVNELRTAWESGDRLVRRAGPWCRHCPILDECPEGQATVALID